MNGVSFVFLLLSLCFFSYYRLKVLLIFFQQEEYNGKWFLQYAFKNLRLFDKKLVVALAVLWFFSCFYDWGIWAIFPLLAYFAYKQKWVLDEAKKKLSMTSRVKRIMSVSLGIVVLLSIILSKISWFATYILVIEFLPIILVLSNVFLVPVENKIQKKFLLEAERNLKECHPVVIGITGSYGKTSTKHILGHILNSVAPTLWTPGSVNTKMGICRIIREKLKPTHRYFIVEMGAYFKGSIERLCKFVNPQHGIITSVGEAHYEHFSSQKNIAEAKFELGDWVHKNEGFLVIGSNQILEKYIPDYPLVKVGDKENIHVENMHQTSNGLSFLFCYNNEKIEVEVPLYGMHHIGNVALALEMAIKLGVPVSTAVSALKHLPQIAHRLEVKKQGNLTIIDDAYNSNPEGFKSALQLLSVFEGGRKILVTPGMVELGELHDSAHLSLGREAGKRVDIVLLVVSERIPSFIKGFNETSSSDKQLIKVSSFKEAFAWIQKNALPGDVILLENDLPDVYETRFSL